MRNFLLLLIVAAVLIYAYRSSNSPANRSESGKPEAVQAQGGGPVGEWQQAPNAVMGMQDAIGDGHRGAANAARNAARDQAGR